MVSLQEPQTKARESAEETKRYRIVVGKQGRVVLPAGIREELEIQEGEKLVAYVDDRDRLVILPRKAFRRHLREAFGAVPDGVDVVQELLDERRREATRELSETDAGS